MLKGISAEELRVKFIARHCTLCGSQAPKTHLYSANFDPKDLNAAVFSARRSPDRKHFRFVECHDCGMIFSDPTFDSAFLPKLYSESLVNYDPQVDQIYDSYLPILDVALTRVRQRGVFLEIGGGSGFMLRYGFENGFSEQIEIEPSKNALEKFKPFSPQSRFIQECFTKGSLPKGSVHLACFFQVLDHISDPASFLESVLEIMEPAGVVVCVTHNTQALSAKLLGERSPIFDIEHTYLFNLSNIELLFRKVGFERIETFPISNRYSLKIWLHLLPMPSFIRRLVLFPMRCEKIANLRFKIRAGNLALIAQKPS